MHIVVRAYQQRLSRCGNRFDGCRHHHGGRRTLWRHRHHLRLHRRCASTVACPVIDGSGRVQIGQHGTAVIVLGRHLGHLDRSQFGVGVQQIQQAASGDAELHLVQLHHLLGSTDLLLRRHRLQPALGHVGFGGLGLLVDFAVQHVHPALRCQQLLGGTLLAVVGTTVQEVPVHHDARVLVVLADSGHQVHLGPARTLEVFHFLARGVHFILLRQDGRVGGLAVVRHHLAPVRTEGVAQRHVLVGIAAELAQRQTQAFFILHQAHAHLQRAGLGLDQFVVTARVVLHDHAQVVDDAVVALQVALLGIQQFAVAQRCQVLLAHQHGQVFLGFADFFTVVFLVKLVAPDLRAYGTTREQVYPTDQRHRIG